MLVACCWSINDSCRWCEFIPGHCASDTSVFLCCNVLLGGVCEREGERERQRVKRGGGAVFGGFALCSGRSVSLSIFFY